MIDMKCVIHNVKPVFFTSALQILTRVLRIIMQVDTEICLRWNLFNAIEM